MTRPSQSTCGESVRQLHVLRRRDDDHQVRREPVRTLRAGHLPVREVRLLHLDRLADLGDVEGDLVDGRSARCSPAPASTAIGLRRREIARLHALPVARPGLRVRGVRARRGSPTTARSCTPTRPACAARRPAETFHACVPTLRVLRPLGNVVSTTGSWSSPTTRSLFATSYTFQSFSCLSGAGPAIGGFCGMSFTSVRSGLRVGQLLHLRRPRHVVADAEHLQVPHAEVEVGVGRAVDEAAHRDSTDAREHSRDGEEVVVGRGRRLEVDALHRVDLPVREVRQELEREARAVAVDRVGLTRRRLPQRAAVAVLCRRPAPSRS